MLNLWSEYQVFPQLGFELSVTDFVTNNKSQIARPSTYRPKILECIRHHKMIHQVETNQTQENSESQIETSEISQYYLIEHYIPMQMYKQQFQQSYHSTKSASINH